MQQLLLDENNVIEPKERFWQRYFQIEAAEPPRKFDWFFGVIMPVICFVFDPTVFKGGVLGPAFLGTFKPFAYLLSFVSVMAMAAWLIWGAKLKWFNAFLAGLFLVSGIISLGIGLVLFPFSMLGLLILIGALGFTPLFSSVVFLRNAFRAFQMAKPFLEKGVLIRSFALAAIFSAVVPSVINLEIKRVLDEMEKGDAQTIRANSRILKYAVPIINLDKLALRYHRSAPDQGETEEMRTIADVYKELTGEDIETKGRILID